jgi:hypothetical protein
MLTIAQGSHERGLANEEMEKAREDGPRCRAVPFAWRAAPLALAFESFTIVNRTGKSERHHRHGSDGWSSG